MTLRLAGGGRFGSVRRPQVVWAGLDGDVQPLADAGRPPGRRCPDARPARRGPAVPRAPDPRPLARRGRAGRRHAARAAGVYRGPRLAGDRGAAVGEPPRPAAHLRDGRRRLGPAWGLLTRRTPWAPACSRGRSRPAGSGRPRRARRRGRRSAPSNCSIVRGPTIGAVTAGWCSSQARPTSAGAWPSSRQSASYASSAGRCSSTASAVRSSLRRPPSVVSSTPPSRPPASGLHGMMPTP